MFGSSILEVAIGLTLVFLLASLFLTALVEIVESILKTRAADLERAIKLMLQDNSQSAEDFYNHPLVFALFQGEYSQSRKSWFFNRHTGGNLPSYIPRDIFSTVLLDLKRAGRPGNGAAAVVDTYRRLLGEDIVTLRVNLESWYDATMDRTAGWYKRRTQKLLFYMGFALAVALNINPIVIGQHLSVDREARQTMVNLAAALNQNRPPGEADRVPAADPADDPNRGNVEELRRLDRAVRSAGLPIGWNSFAYDRSFPSDRHWVWSVLLAIAGWATTAIAATLGAPFWFDVLNKLMVIRATVKPKEKSRDEASEDRSRQDRRAELTFVGVGAGAETAVAPSFGPNSAANASSDGREDGCLDGYEVPDEAATHDIELPPATGGIKDRD